MDASPGLCALVVSLFDAGAIKIDTKKGFKLKLHETRPDAPLSPYYISLRTPENKGGPLTPALVAEIGKVLWDYAKSKKLPFDGVAGLPKAGEPLAEGFAWAAREDGEVIPFIRLHKSVSEQSRRIDDIESSDTIKRGNMVLVIDDLITEGHTKDEGISVLETKGGFCVGDILVLVDREQGGASYLASKGKRLHALLTVPQMLTVLVDEGKISTETRQTVLNYIDNARQVTVV